MTALLARNWWALAGRGGAALAFMLLLFTWPSIGTRSLAATFTLFVGLYGAFTMIAATAGDEAPRPMWRLAWSGGVSLVAASAFLLGPFPALQFEYLVGGWAIATGALELWAAAQLRRELTDDLTLIAGAVAGLALGALLGSFARMGIDGGHLPFAAYALVTGTASLRLAIRLERLDSAGPLASP